MTRSSLLYTSGIKLHAMLTIVYNSLVRHFCGKIATFDQEIKRIDDATIFHLFFQTNTIAAIEFINGPLQNLSSYKIFHKLKYDKV